MPELSIVQQTTVWILPVLFAITLHEASHAWVASLLGDTTAKSLGRLSFNPLKHVDLIGTVLIPILTLVLSNFNFVFGWAKPVPINPSNFAHPRRDLALATAAGPLANLFMALLWALLFKVGLLMHYQTSIVAVFIILAANAGIIINLLLAFLNLIPIPPLDGSKIVMGFLSAKQALAYQKIEPFGFVILLLLLVTGILNLFISPPINASLIFLKQLFNI